MTAVAASPAWPAALPDHPNPCECGHCQRCYKQRYRAKWTPEKVEEERAKDRERARRRRTREPEVHRERNYAYRIANPEIIAEQQRRYRTRNRDKYNARNTLKRAVKSGKLERLACEMCGELNTEGHHEDYAKPLEVRWLCREHHLIVHGKRT